MEKKRLQTSINADFFSLLKFLSKESGLQQSEILEQAIGNWCTSYMGLNSKSELNSDIRGGYNYACLGSALATAYEKYN